MCYDIEEHKGETFMDMKVMNQLGAGIPEEEAGSYAIYLTAGMLKAANPEFSLEHICSLCGVSELTGAAYEQVKQGVLAYTFTL